MSGASQRPSPHEYRIAAVCALREESAAVEAMFDQNWEKEHKYPRYGTDDNEYSMGRIGVHNVVLALMPGMGKVSASALVAQLRNTFRRIEICLIVGICGGVPFLRDAPFLPRSTEVLLGDIVISTTVVQWDFGRQYPNELVRLTGIHQLLGRPHKRIRAFLHKMSSLYGLEVLRNGTALFLATLLRQKGFENSQYPGSEHDTLFKSSYRHKHRLSASCNICARCENERDAVCETALDASCENLKCDTEEQLRRHRLDSNAADTEPPPLHIHFGSIASGDAVMKSAFHRDELAAKEEVIGFEMEGAGTWDDLPTVIIKSVVDYSDGHKSYLWRCYGAARAAACFKAFVREWRPTEEMAQPQAEPSAPDLTAQRIHEPAELANRESGNQADIAAIRKGLDDAHFLLDYGDKATRKEDLENVIVILQQAEIKSKESDHSHLQRIYWGLMVAEKQLSCYKGFRIAEKIEHVKEAQRYSVEIENTLSQSPDASKHAQVSLEQQILKGWKASLHFDEGRDMDKVTKMKLDATVGIDEALKELQEVDPNSFYAVSKAAYAWRKYFGDTSF